MKVAIVKLSTLAEAKRWDVQNYIHSEAEWAKKIAQAELNVRRAQAALKRIKAEAAANATRVQKLIDEGKVLPLEGSNAAQNHD